MGVGDLVSVCPNGALEFMFNGVVNNLIRSGVCISNNNNNNNIVHLFELEKVIRETDIS